MVTERDWRDVLHAYLLAVREDEIRNRQQSLSGAEAEFLSRFGGGSLRQRHAKKLQLHRDALTESPQVMPFIVINESAEEVLVQINAKGTGSDIPPTAMRFLLIRCGSEWFLEGLFRPCIACNSSALLESPTSSSHGIGKCDICRGTGKGYSFSWLSLLRKSKPVLDRPPCQFCNGTGKCPHCAKESHPGWMSVDAMPL
jgi:hypothetical protein